MTREEAKGTLIHALRWNDMPKKEALEMAIQALSQEPCDAVSREAVLDLCDSKDPDYKVIHFKEDVECLPSVNPQPKTGRWINDKCSVCGKGIEDLISSCEWYRNEEPKFCPFCGVKIDEVEE